jgi:hypothetical protein
MRMTSFILFRTTVSQKDCVLVDTFPNYVSNTESVHVWVCCFFGW